LFIDKCEKSSKKISLWFLDRTSLKDYIIYTFSSGYKTKGIDLNNYKINHNKVLFDILNFKLKDVTKEKLDEYVELITKRFDPGLCRPIWAVMMSELLKVEPHYDFNNYASKGVIIKEYWNLLLKRKKLEDYIEKIVVDLGLRQEDIIIYKNKLINQAESLILFSAITSISVYINDSTDNRTVTFIYKGEKYENSYLETAVLKALRLNDEAIIRHQLLIQLFPNNESDPKKKTIKIQTNTFDMINAWLLNNIISGQNGEDSIIVDLLKCVNSEMSNNIIVFVTRAYEEDSGRLLYWWISKFINNGASKINSKGYEEWITQWCKLYPLVKKTELGEYMVKIINNFVSTIDNEEDYIEFYLFTKLSKQVFISSGNRECIELIEELNLYKPNDISKIISKGDKKYE